MKEIWDRIDNWLKIRAPRVFADLERMGGASEEDIQRFESPWGVPLPIDVRETYRIHNGAYIANDFEFPPLNGLYVKSTPPEGSADYGGHIFRNEISDEPDGTVLDWYWHPNWLVIDYFGTGNYLFIDLCPAPGGIPGQVILRTREGANQMIAPTFRAYVEQFATDLENGKYEYEEEDEDTYGLYRY